jgi:signal peptidase
MGTKDRTKASNKSKDSRPGLLQDIIFVISAVVVYLIISHFWISMVAVESGSMIPHIEVGDIIFVENIDLTQIITYETYETGNITNYTSFGEPGDVILYRPLGRDVTPIIHRAMYYVETGEPMWAGGPPAPHAGYITKGDNTETNPAYDQQGSISYLQPVKKEWIIGVAKFNRVPLLGCISLIPRGNFACLERKQ